MTGRGEEKQWVCVYPGTLAVTRAPYHTPHGVCSHVTASAADALANGRRSISINMGDKIYVYDKSGHLQLVQAKGKGTHEEA